MGAVILNLPLPATQPNKHTMPTITVTTPRPASPFEPGDLIIDPHDNEPWKRTLPMLFIKLGQKLIEHGHHQNPDDCWLSLAQVSAYCRRYKLSWQGSIKGRDFECSMADLFGKSGEVTGGGVRVEHKIVRTERRRLPVTLLKFSKVYPDGTSA
jgi:hypothetical protein